VLDIDVRKVVGGYTCGGEAPNAAVRRSAIHVSLSIVFVIVIVRFLSETQVDHPACPASNRAIRSAVQPAARSAKLVSIFLPRWA
jgi:hypothetical protein